MLTRLKKGMSSTRGNEGACPLVREQETCRFQPAYCNGRGNPAPTLTRSAYGAFATIRGLFIIVKVGARFPRPHIVGEFSDSLIYFH